MLCTASSLEAFPSSPPFSTPKVGQSLAAVTTGAGADMLDGQRYWLSPYRFVSFCQRRLYSSLHGFGFEKKLGQSPSGVCTKSLLMGHSLSNKFRFQRTR